MSTAKNVLLHSYSSMKKKFRKIQMIFNIENWIWKSNFGTFLTACHYSNSRNLLILFDYCWFLAQNLSNFASLSRKLHNRHCLNSDAASGWATREVDYAHRNTACPSVSENLTASLHNVYCVICSLHLLMFLQKACFTLWKYCE